MGELTKKSFEQVALEDAPHSMNGSFELLLLRPPQFSAVVIQKPQGSSGVCSNGADRRVTGVNSVSLALKMCHLLTNVPRRQFVNTEFKVCA